MVISIAWSEKRHWSRSKWLSIHFIFNLSYLKIILTQVILKQWAGKHDTDIESGGQSASTNSPIDSFRSNSNLRHKTVKKGMQPSKFLFVLVGKLCLTLCDPVTCQAPPSMGFPRQEYWSGLPSPPPRDRPNPGTEPESPALVGRLFTTEPRGSPYL